MIVSVGGEQVSPQAWVTASDVQRQAWRWNAAVQTYDATVGYINLIGGAWTGNVLEAAS